MGSKLTGLNLTPAGTYQVSDIDKFHLHYSADAVLDEDDEELATLDRVGPGNRLAFAFDESPKAIPAGETGYLLITADIADPVETDGTIGIAAPALTDVQFLVDPKRVGSDLPAGETYTLYASPVVQVRTPKIPEAEVAQGEEHLLYQITLSGSDNNTVLTGLTLIPKGTYTPSDIEKFTVYHSEDNSYDTGDKVFAKTSSEPIEVVPPDHALVLNGTDPLSIAKGETVHLFVTANIHEDAEGGHNIYMEAINPDNLTYDPSDTVCTAEEDLLAGGTQTFPLSPYTDMAAGFYHTVALKGNGTVWAWGNNENGQVGDGTTDDTLIALPVSDMTQIDDVAAGDFFSLALKTDGTVWA